MNKELKELVTTLLKAIILDGKRGIDNAVQDKDLYRLDLECSKIDYAVKELINLTENEEGFSYYLFGRMLRKVNPNAKDMESSIKEMISLYNEGKTALSFNDDEINELAKLLAEM